MVVPVLLFLLIGALDLGRVFYSQIAVTDAAKEGALVASQGGSTSDIAAAVVAEAKGGLVEVQPADVTSTTCPVNPDGATPPVIVTAHVPFHAITPFISTVLGGSDVAIGSTATARCRYTPPFPGTPSGTPTTTPTPIPTPTPTPTPTCGTVSFVATNSSNGGHPHRMDLAGFISPSSSGWTWTWSGGLSASGQTVNNHDFSASGPTSVTLTASKGACTVSTTQTVNVP